MIAPKDRRVGQPQVSAKYIDTLLPPKAEGFVCHTSHRVHACNPHSNIRVAKLGSSGIETFNESSLLKIALAAVSNDQSDDATNPCNDCERKSGDVNRVGFVVARVN
ncbi:hypothetical protein R1CP_40420 (plasmid) [Rhodococcus opacus]|uniref:Uncharacterized protein n=1 Tax=Rhodococcus opacus TaxID=37919 RepID=A0A1B1KJB1_RHOOP|nr:hypothetical protein R1CP_40420 [Rhodococcus opacus]